LGDFEIGQNCARKIVHARKLASNWESLLSTNILKKPDIVVGQQSIGIDYAIRVGDFPVILFRIQESFALNVSAVTFSQI
jgi:hypothetical protein